jgi:hypothetical protein
MIAMVCWSRDLAVRQIESARGREPGFEVGEAADDSGWQATVRPAAWIRCSAFLSAESAPPDHDLGARLSAR